LPLRNEIAREEEKKYLALTEEARVKVRREGGSEGGREGGKEVFWKSMI